MPRIIPFNKCPKCGSNVLIQHYDLMVSIVYFHGVKHSHKIKRVNDNTKMICGKCGYMKIFKTPLKYKQVI